MKGAVFCATCAKRPKAKFLLLINLSADVCLLPKGAWFFNAILRYLYVENGNRGGDRVD